MLSTSCALQSVCSAVLFFVLQNTPYRPKRGAEIKTYDSDRMFLLETIRVFELNPSLAVFDPNCLKKMRIRRP